MIVAIFGRLAAAIELTAWRFHVARMRSRYDVDPSFTFHLGSRVHGTGRIVLGPHSYLNNHANLRATAPHAITVGRGCRIGPFVRVYTQTVDPDADLSQDDLPRKVGDVTIEDWAWIGSSVYIGPGVTIGENSVVGANSVVTRDVEPFEIVAGAPLRHQRYKPSRPPTE